MIGGMEGSGKSVLGFTVCKYLDPSFPGEPLNDGTTRRKCTRIVFTPQQTIEAIDNSKPEQAILMDEAILNFMAQDASSEIQKILIKKMVTIRKKRLYLVIILPSIFLLRKYMAIFRTRALIHLYSPDGVTRGYAKVYSYDTKRKLYIRGIKEFNQDCVKPDFKIRTTDSTGFFFDDNEYQLKKNEAIKEITTVKDKNKGKVSKTVEKYKIRSNYLIYKMHNYFKLKDSKHSLQDTADFFILGHQVIRNALEEHKKYLEKKAKEIEEIAKRDRLIEGYKKQLSEKK